MRTDYVKRKINNILSIQKIVTLHYFEFDRDFSFAGESHDFWEMVYADKGELQIVTKNREFTLSQGECYFHKPNEFHIHRADGVIAPNVFVISFVCGSESMKFFKSRQIRVPAKLRGLISNIIEEGRQTFDLPFNDPGLKELKLLPDRVVGGQQMIRTYLEQFLILLLRHECSATDSKVYASKEVMNEQLAGEMLEKLNQTVYGNVSVEEFCKEMRYSKAYLSKIFQESYHCTIGQYMTKIKIEEAKKLIREHHYNFTQIADLLCFSDALYFSRVFRKVTGMSPSEYRRSVKVD